MHANIHKHAMPSLFFAQDPIAVPVKRRLHKQLEFRRRIHVLPQHIQP
jgi:hypothetical protein